MLDSNRESLTPFVQQSPSKRHKTQHITHSAAHWRNRNSARPISQADTQHALLRGTGLFTWIALCSDRTPTTDGSMKLATFDTGKLDHPSPNTEPSLRVTRWDRPLHRIFQQPTPRPHPSVERPSDEQANFNQSIPGALAGEPRRNITSKALGSCSVQRRNLAGHQLRNWLDDVHEMPTNVSRDARPNRRASPCRLSFARRGHFLNRRNPVGGNVAQQCDDSCKPQLCRQVMAFFRLLGVGRHRCVGVACTSMDGACQCHLYRCGNRTGPANGGAQR